MTPRYFLDANIIIDALLHRGSEAVEAGALIDLGYHRKVTLLVTPMSLGVVLYVLQIKRYARRPGPKMNKVKAMLHDLLLCVDVIPVTRGNFSQSLSSTFHDLEDGAQYAAAIASGRITAIVTGDADYKGNVTPKLYTASEALRDALAHIAKPQRRMK